MIKKHLPNFITCLNLFAGCMAAVAAFNDMLTTAAYLLFVAALFDFFDGMVARLVNAYSELGKQLDSLADMVSFGFVPALMVYKLFQNALSHNGLISLEVDAFLPFLAFSIAVFSALRLAKFNIDTRQTTSFIGVPTPANALFICGLAFLQKSDWGASLAFLSHAWFYLLLIPVLSYWLVAELPLFALKFKQFGFKGNQIRYLFLASALLLLILGKLAALPLVIFLYVGLSIIHNFVASNTDSKSE